MADLSPFLEPLNVDDSHSHGQELNPATDFNLHMLVLRHTSTLAYHTFQEMANCSDRLMIAFDDNDENTLESFPSSAPLSRLTPILLLNMKLGLTHYCHFVVGYLCVDAFATSSIRTILEVGDGMGVCISISNAAPLTASLSHIQSLFPKGAHIAIKEPFLKRSPDGIVSICIENPHNIEILDPPCRCRQLDHDELRKEGNRRFQERDWEGAIESYTSCLQLINKKSPVILSQEAKLGEKHCELLAYSNRAEAWRRLNRFKQALRDSIRALQIDPNHVKSLFRKGLALHGFGQYKRACSSLQQALEIDPECKEIQDALQRSRRCCTSETDCFDHIGDFLVDLLSKRDVVLPDCYDYTGSVVVRMTSNGRGRGLFASRDLKHGELLLVSNPLAIEYYDQEADIISIDPPTQCLDSATEDLVIALLSLTKSSRQARYHLHTLQASSNSSNSLVPPMEMFGNAMDGSWAPDYSTELGYLDIHWISRIVHFNSFTGYGRSHKMSMARSESMPCFTGIWLLPSFINHSCLQNAKRVQAGEAMLIHAASDIKEGEEITISYFDTLLPLLQREEKFMTLGFSCKCERCLVERSLSNSTIIKSFEFDVLHERAVEEATSKLKAGKVYPTKLPKCAVFAGLTLELEKVMGASSKLSPVQKKWIRASYANAYLAAMIASGFQFELSAEEIVEAITSASPGHPRILSIIAWQLFKSMQGNGNGNGCFNLDDAMDACIRTYGNWKPDILERLIAFHVAREPFP